MDYTQEELERAHQIVDAARAKERAAEAADARQLIGRYFKSKNRYGNDGWWWLYVVPTKVSEWGNLTGLQFQRKKDDDHDGIEIEPDASLITLQHRGVSSDGWIEIQKSESDAAFAAVLSAAMEMGRAVGAVDPVGEKVTGRPRA